MTRRIYILLLFCGGLSTFSQEVDASFSDYEKHGFREIHEMVLGHQDSSYDLLRVKYNAFGEPTIYADHFEAPDLMRKYAIKIYKKDLYKDQLNSRIFFESAFTLDSNLIVLFSSVNNEKLENTLYATRYVGGYQMGGINKITTIQMPNRYEKGRFIIGEDRDQNNFVTIGFEPGERKKSGLFRISLFNKDLSAVWKQNLSSPYRENRYDLEQIAVDADNRIFLLFKILLDRDQQLEQNLPNSDHYFSLLQLSQSQDEDYIETVLKIENKSIYNMFLNLKAKSGKILMSGLYNDKRGELKPTGVYYATMEKDSTTPAVVKMQSFNDDFVPDFQLESPFSEQPDQEPEIKLIDFIKTPNKDYYLLAEYTLINETCIPDFRTALMSCTYNYYYNEIFVFRFDSAGSLLRKYKIPKRQYTKNDEGTYSSFAYGFIQDKLVLLYNDHPKNARPKNPENLRFMTEPKRSVLAAVVIDNNGDVHKMGLVNNEKKKSWCKPKVSFQFGPKSIIVFAEKGRWFQSIRVTESTE